jgi:hypothetical protein
MCFFARWLSVTPRAFAWGVSARGLTLAAWPLASSQIVNAKKNARRKNQTLNFTFTFSVRIQPSWPLAIL